MQVMSQRKYGNLGGFLKNNLCQFMITNIIPSLLQCMNMIRKMENNILDELKKNVHYIE